MTARAQRLESLIILTSGIAHEFNNILTCIINHTQLLKMQKIPDEHYQKNSLELILQAAYQARDLVKQFVAFGRKTEQVKAPVMLEQVVRDMVKMIRAFLPSTIHIQEQIGADPYTVFADSSQMQQVLINLFTNAAHAMGPRKGVLKIELDRVTLESSHCRSMGNITPGPYVVVLISDTGDGIPPDIMPQIFDPYFTTKSREEGTGLGLFVTQGIVHNHGGVIRVSSRLGQGTTFKVFIPYFKNRDSESAK